MARNYVNNKDLYNALVEHRKVYDECIKNGKEPPELPRYVGESFLAIGRGLAKKYRFASYSWKEDLISLGLLDCVKYWRTFNPEKSNNPFAFFTAVFTAAFFRYNNREEKEKYIKYKTCIMKGMEGQFLSLRDEDGSDDDTMRQEQLAPYENIGEFVDEYEKRLDVQKEKNRESHRNRKNRKPKTLY